MVSNLQALQLFDYLAETFVPVGEGQYVVFLYTSFTRFDGEDSACLGRLPRPKLVITLGEKFQPPSSSSGPWNTTEYSCR